MVSTWTKSAARMPRAWAVRNCFQVGRCGGVRGRSRRRAGSATPWRRRSGGRARLARAGAPARIAGCHPDHEPTDRGCRGRPSGTPPAGVVPLVGDQPPVPGEQRRRGHREHLTPTGVRHPWTSHPGPAPSGNSADSARPGRRPRRSLRDDPSTRQAVQARSSNRAPHVLQDVMQTAALAIRRSSGLETPLPLREKHTLHAISPRPKASRAAPGTIIPGARDQDFPQLSAGTSRQERRILIG